MTALSAPRKTVRLAEGRMFSHPVKATAVCLAGGLAMLASGVLIPARSGQGATNADKAADALTYAVVGIFIESVTGGATDGAVRATIEGGTYGFANSAATDTITRADIGNHAFVVDDQTVARSSATMTRPIAGIIADVDADGTVWVEVGVTEARGAARRIFLSYQFLEANLISNTPLDLVSPVAGNVNALHTVVDKAVTTGGTLGARVNGVTNVVGIAAAVANAAVKGVTGSSAATAGDASRAVKPGDRISIVPTGFATAGVVNGILEIVY